MAIPTPNDYQRNANLKRLYGIDLNDYNQMLDEQKGVCAICKENPRTEALAVDHDHATGKIRKLLCKYCNLGLGSFKDDIRLLAAAIQYLEDHKLTESLELDETRVT